MRWLALVLVLLSLLPRLALAPTRAEVEPRGEVRLAARGAVPPPEGRLVDGGGTEGGRPGRTHELGCAVAVAWCARDGEAAPSPGGPADARGAYDVRYARWRWVCDADGEVVAGVIQGAEYACDGGGERTWAWTCIYDGLRRRIGEAFVCVYVYDEALPPLRSCGGGPFPLRSVRPVGTCYRYDRYTGLAQREMDSPSVGGFQYTRARHYDPSIGRFVQRDPIRVLEPQTHYVYASNSPTRQLDPTGQDDSESETFLKEHDLRIDPGALRFRYANATKEGNNEEVFRLRVREAIYRKLGRFRGTMFYDFLHLKDLENAMNQGIVFAKSVSIDPKLKGTNVEGETDGSGADVTITLAEDPLNNDEAMTKAAHESVHAWLYSTGQKPFWRDDDERIAYYAESFFADDGVGLQLSEFERNVREYKQGGDRNRSLKMAGQAWKSVMDLLSDETEYYVGGTKRTFKPDNHWRFGALTGKFGAFTGISNDIDDTFAEYYNRESDHPELKDVLNSVTFNKQLK